MWLIDSGELMEKIQKRVKNSLIRAWLYNIIAEVPGIDAEPVIQGNWGKPIRVDADNNGYRCSNCGEFGAPCWNYCPNCGARMDAK